MSLNTQDGGAQPNSEPWTWDGFCEWVQPYILYALIVATVIVLSLIVVLPLYFGALVP